MKGALGPESQPAPAKPFEGAKLPKRRPVEVTTVRSTSTPVPTSRNRRQRTYPVR